MKERSVREDLQQGKVRRQAVVVMVHGTYAADDQDCGESWWQANSPAALKLQSMLPESTQIASVGEVFHWSGANSDRARRKAGAHLLHHLQSLESQEYDYHLIGHSHGGSVIWNALQSSLLSKRPLQGLRSWTTIGTPFLQQRHAGGLNLKNLALLMLGLMLLWPAMAAPKHLFQSLYNAATDNRTELVLDPESKLGFASRLRGPVLAMVESTGIAVDRQPDGVHVGSFDPAGDQSVAEYFFATPEGIFLLLLMTAICYCFIHCAALCLTPAVESFRLRVEKRLRERAFEKYRDRWLGIWSPDDEAINGLRATLDVSVSFVKEFAPREVVYLSDRVALLSRPYFWIFAPFYNRFVHPAVDGKVRNVVVRSAQGIDRPGATLIEVSPYPVPIESFSPPPIPALLNVRLLSFANRHAHELVPKLRSLIAQTSFTSGFESFGRQLSGKELVHTAYFEQDEILELIAANIHWESPGNDRESALAPLPPWLGKWFVTYKQGMKGSIQPPGPEKSGNSKEELGREAA